MARYIKLEDAIEVCGKYKDFHKKENCRLGMAIVNDIYLDIDNLPTADVEEVKHGEWIECSNELNKYCSVCKKVNGTIYEKPPFCENCGAKMDGGKEDV